jgi:hypothetical protein
MLTSPHPDRARAGHPGNGNTRWVVVGGLVVAGLLAMMVAGWVLAPLDGLLTKQVCADYGDQLGREVVSYERSNRVAVFGRTSGSCTYAAPEADPAAALLTVSIPETDPSRLYGAVKVMLFIVKLGAASAAVRLLADPLFGRFVPEWSDN